ncbi:MAG TPA: OmpA family protein [Ohtaekwangia sp.]|uniref:OmpA family protein n=1 Tax=Ohtaekwangia sp. TaxID=2066019 RepID=UPI002F958432
MKTLKLFALVGIFSVLFTLQPTVASRLEQANLDAFQNYVVIGAFKYHRNAVRFRDHAQKDLNLDAKYEKNQNRDLYYVYVMSTTDRAAAITEAKRLRAEPELTETWVYSGSLNKEADQPVARGVDINPVTDQKIEAVSTQDHGTETTTALPETTTPVAEKTAPETPQPVEPDNGVEGKKFFFRIYRGTDNSIIEGDVAAIDVDRTRKMGTFKGNIPVKVPDPASKSDNVSFVCEVFGFRKTQRDLNYNTPEGEDIETDDQGATVIPFELVRLQKGDIAIMYHVFFFKDAAIMRPESKYEVTSLLNMLNENPKYKIRIHGHTNGGASGKIISKPKDSNEYFSLTNAAEGFGTAKKLSEERAIIIRDYLASNGIDPARMEVKAWGGKKPIYDKLGAHASENVRVEIEILQN